MNIGEAAELSGVNAKLIRHYESIALIPKAKRSDSGYRVYSENEVHILKFIKRARNLGFSMKEIKKLVGLWRNKSRASSEVKSMAMTHLRSLEKKFLSCRKWQIACVFWLVIVRAMTGPIVLFSKIFPLNFSSRHPGKKKESEKSF